MAEGRRRPAWAEIDLSALRHNAALLKQIAGESRLCAVVKADGYGHGAVDAARAAMEGGAPWLAVALIDEGIELRDAGIDAPILLLSEPDGDALNETVAAGLTPTVTCVGTVDRLSRAAVEVGAPTAVHVKVDTGMHRVGATPTELETIVEGIADAEALSLGGVWTHLAVADGVGEEDREFTDLQIERFNETVNRQRVAGVEVGILHAANSAGTIAYPHSRFDMVRCGIALYGDLPSPHHADVISAATDGTSLRPVMSLHARVTASRCLRAGDRPSYGRHRALPTDATVATVPLGYADGVPRRLFETGGEVLIRGVRRPLAGMVTMDQIVVDCGDDEISPGELVTLLGRQGEGEIVVAEWAKRLGTIGYEILCGIGPRVPRVTVNSEVE